MGVQALSIPPSVSSPSLLVLGLFCRKLGSPNNQRNQRMQTPSGSVAAPRDRPLDEISKREGGLNRQKIFLWTLLSGINLLAERPSAALRVTLETMLALERTKCREHVNNYT